MQVKQKVLICVTSKYFKKFPLFRHYRWSRVKFVLVHISDYQFIDKILLLSLF